MQRRSAPHSAPRGRLTQPGALQAAHAAATAATSAVIAIDTRIEILNEQVTTAFEGHPQTATITSLPGTGSLVGARACSPSSVTHPAATAQARPAGILPGPALWM
ncbi:hypothetical protein [Rhodococcus sp. T7]|uniref:hypothetical protein n=1 Tax=Rhodococcus sp. T7 TaxID=627444 RepID=UPI00135842CE|nr:hypothetical protein [Rhodococcus sp. T7]